MTTWAGILLAGTALAAGHTSGVQEAVSPSERGRSTDVLVVTADRSARPLAETAVSVAVLETEALGTALSEVPAEVVNRAPGVFVQAGSGQEHLTSLRSPVLTGGAGAGSFLYLQDGVPLRSAGFANVNGLFDTQLPFAARVEVVRGPGDVTYGSNAVHGAINVLSPSPLGADRTRARVGVASFGRYTGTASVRRAVGGHGLFAGIHAYDDGGYREDSGVLQLKGQLAHGWSRGTTEVTTRLNLHHLEQETGGFVVGDDAFRDDALRRSNPNPEAFRDLDHALLSSRVRTGVAGGTLEVTPYALATRMDFKLHFLPSQALEENDHWAVGTLSSYTRDLGPRTVLLAGVDLEYAAGTLREVQDIPTVFSFTQGLHYDYRVTSVSAAPFVRLRRAVTERLSVQGGVRLNTTRYDYDNRTEDGMVGRFIRPADRTDTFTVATGRLAATWAATDRVTVFAAVSRGARPPQTTDLYRLQQNQTADGIDPETLDMGELGVRLSGGRLSAEVVGFYGRKDNFLFRDADGFTVDDGATLHRGVEFLADWRITEDLSLRLAGTVADHDYDFTRVVSRDSEVIVAGTEVDTAPNTLLDARLTWSPTPRFETALGLTHVGGYNLDAAGTRTYPGHEVLDLFARYRLSDRVAVSGELSNLTDERYATRADFAFGNERYFPGEERALSAAVSVDW